MIQGFNKRHIKIPQYILKSYSKRSGISNKHILEYLKKIDYEMNIQEKRALKKISYSIKRKRFIMTALDSVILGIIEGFTEFLPISSTGHLIVASEFLGIDQNSVTKAYEVIIQFAAILAVILNYPSKFTFKHFDLWTKIFIAFLPIATIGFLFSSQVKAMFSLEIVATMFIIGGIVFFNS